MEASTGQQHAAQAARTQSLFRDVNERVREINEAFNLVLPLGDWICECASHGCTDRVALSIEDYEALRANPRRFLVLPDDGHVVPEVEEVVERRERYWVVEKVGEAGELATKVDPRAIGLRGGRQLAGTPTG